MGEFDINRRWDFNAGFYSARFSGICSRSSEAARDCWLSSRTPVTSTPTWSLAHGTCWPPSSALREEKTSSRSSVRAQSTLWWSCSCRACPAAAQTSSVSKAAGGCRFTSTNCARPLSKSPPSSFWSIDQSATCSTPLPALPTRLPWRSSRRLTAQQNVEQTRGEKLRKQQQRRRSRERTKRKRWRLRSPRGLWRTKLTLSACWGLVCRLLWLALTTTARTPELQEGLNSCWTCCLRRSPRILVCRTGFSELCSEVIRNGNRTESSSIRSVITRVITDDRESH